MITPNNKLIIILIFIACLAIIVYKFGRDEFEIENFENKLSQLKESNKKNNKNKKRNSNSNSNSNSKSKNNSNSNSSGNKDDSLFSSLIGGGNKKKNSYGGSSSGVTFNDLMDITEKMEPEKYTYDNMKGDIMTYYKSFKKEPFSSDSKDTTEALEKFKFYKKKFFEIFE